MAAILCGRLQHMQISLIKSAWKKIQSGTMVKTTRQKRKQRPKNAINAILAMYFFWQKKLLKPLYSDGFCPMGRLYLVAEKRKKIILSQLNAIDNTEMGCCENPHPRSFMMGIWSTMGKKYWGWICRILPPPSLLLVSCWDLNKPKDYLRAFKCKFWWMCKAPPVNLSLIICLPDYGMSEMGSWL